jgi:hypothetical protein
MIRPTVSTTNANMQHQLSPSLQQYRPSITSLPSRTQKDSDDTPVKHSLGRRWRKRLVRFGQTLALASALSSVTPKAAHAKFSHELQEERTISLRPGVSNEQANAMIEGELPDDLPESATTLLQTNQPQEKQATTPKKKAAASKKSFDYGDEEDDDGFEEDFFMDEKSVGAPRNTPGRSSISKSDSAKSANFQAATKSQFSGMGPKSKSQSKLLTLKVSVGLFIPTWGAMGVREFVRRGKERTYVQKGLEILEAQKAEYFNITETTDDDDDDDEDDDDDDDSDDEDGDDEDDDDNEDNDEEDEPSSRRRPKRPSGGGGDDGAGDGSGRPSDDDLKRLGDIFNKS